MVNYNVQRHNLALQHTDALKKLDTIYKSRVGNFVTSMDGMTPERMGTYIYKEFPTFSKPFQKSAAQVGYSFYNLRRQQFENSVAKTLPPLRTTFSDLPLKAISEGTNSQVGMLINIARDHVDDVREAVPYFTSVASNFVTDADREVVVNLSEKDPQSSHLQRIANADACEWCQMMADDNPSTFGSHNNCFCVWDPSFEGEKTWSLPG